MSKSHCLKLNNNIAIFQNVSFLSNSTIQSYQGTKLKYFQGCHLWAKRFWLIILIRNILRAIGMAIWGTTNIKHVEGKGARPLPPIHQSLFNRSAVAAGVFQIVLSNIYQAIHPLPLKIFQKTNSSCNACS